MSSPVQPPLRVETVDGTTSGRPITTIKVTNGDLTISGSTATIDTSGGGGTGTVTSVSTSQAFITITNPTTTPSISIGNASGAATGVLTASDFNTFDAKQDAITLTTTGTSGAATFSAGTLNIPQYSGTTGTVTSITAGDGLSGGTITGSGTIAIPTQGSVSAGAYTNTNITVDARGIITDIANGSSGGVTFPIEADSGSAGVPSYSFSADTDTGIYLSGASNMGIVAGSNSYLSIGSLGAVQFDKKALFNVATEAAPNGFATDTNTGFFQAAADTISLSNAGSETFRFGSSGEILIGGSAAGTSGQVLTSGGSGAAVSWADASGGSPGGSDTYVQFNDGGSFGGNNKMVYTAASGVLTLTNYAQFNNVQVGFNAGVITTNSAGNMTLQPFYGINAGTIVIGGTSNSDITLTPNGTGAVEISGAYKLPTAVTGTNDYVLTAQTDGSTAWAAVSGGGISAGEDTILGNPVSMDSTSRCFNTNFRIGGGNYTSNASVEYSIISLYPFIAPHTATVNQCSIEVATSAAGRKLLFGIYDSDSTSGLPDSKVAECEFSMAATGVITQSSFTGTPALTRGKVYWAAHISDDNASGSGAVKGRENNPAYNAPSSIPIGRSIGSSFGNAPPNCCTVNAGAGAQTLPASITADDIIGDSRDLAHFVFEW